MNDNILLTKYPRLNLAKLDRDFQHHRKTIQAIRDPVTRQLCQEALERLEDCCKP